MDNLTHALTGMVIAKTGLDRNQPKIAVRALWVSALFPDIDCVVQLFRSEEFIFYHRGFTHSLFGLPIFALLLGALFYAFSPSERHGPEGLTPPLRGDLLGKARGFLAARRLWYLSLLCALGLLSHIGLDLITSYGTLILAPFSDRRYFLDYVFIIDPIFTAIVGLPLLYGWWRGQRSEQLHRASLLLLLVYIGFCGLHRQIALNRVQEAALRLNPEVRRIDVLPQPLSPFRWTGLVETPTGSYQTWFGVYSSKPLQFQAFPYKANPYVRIANRLELIKLYHWFARYPIIHYKEMGNRHVVEYFDLRFNTALPGLGFRRYPFVMEVILDGRGRVLKQGFKRFHS
ncbi:MAG: metal-dependent hydrolase [Candidatus Tectomicrobia bacterium]|uniref:Metal-dependent hydrolase n=1 Tax=Tectimicrobiota bacterium TaxID=2528274 RepID=A0A932CNP2_UNCTE|nr:metal-dependent hydrolase [Candidatus Tectomicrobia bacterium]